MTEDSTNLLLADFSNIETAFHVPNRSRRLPRYQTWSFPYGLHVLRLQCSVLGILLIET